MKKGWKIFFGSFALIRRDPMLALLLAAPFLAGSAFRFGLPPLSALLLSALHYNLAPWYALADMMLLVLTPMMAGMMTGFLMLDERDEGVGVYYAVTPLGGKAYLLSRLVLPVLWSVAIAPVLVLMFSLSHPSPPRVWAIALTGGFFGSVNALMLLAFAQNKVEGMAVSKLLGLTMLPMFVPFLTDSPWTMFAGVFPAYWMGALLKKTPAFLPAALLVNMIWLIPLYRRTIRKL